MLNTPTRPATASTLLTLITLYCLLNINGGGSILISSEARRLVPPIVINTWNFTSANVRAWREFKLGHTALDAIEFGCGQCEFDRCDGTVGWGGSPSETGETTLDALIMDGESYDVGAVGGLRRVKSAISVARQVLERTSHTLLVGEMATKFALDLGFKEESLSSNESIELHRQWLNNSCQPNFWKNVSPNPRESCGPYHVLPLKSTNQNSSNKDSEIDLDPAASYETIMLDDDLSNSYNAYASSPNDKPLVLPISHDTIGMVARDMKRKFAAGTSTNGLRNKILGRVGDSPVPGAGAYADRQAGAAAATGDGDVMMRFLLSYQAVENLRQGMSASRAAMDVIRRQARRTGRPYAQAAVIVLGRDNSFGAACSGFDKFPFVVSDALEQYKTYVIDCIR